MTFITDLFNFIESKYEKRIGESSKEIQSIKSKNGNLFKE
jgi:hypothetical protein